MSQAKENHTPPDAFEAFRKVRDSYLEGMSKVMIDAVNSEEYARSTGTLLTNYLALMAPFREALDKSMVMALEQLSLPSREQVTALAERFTNVEMRLDDLDAKLDRMAASSSRSGTPADGASAAAGRPAAANTNASHQARNRKS